MSGGSSTIPVITYGHGTSSSLPPSAFQSPEASSTSTAYTSVSSFQPPFPRLKSESAIYGYDQQAPRSQTVQSNYTHQDLNAADLAHTQALGAYQPSSSPNYANSSRFFDNQTNYQPSHARHQSHNTGVNQNGLGGNSYASYSLDDLGSGQYYNYNLVASQRSPAGRLNGLSLDDSPTRIRYSPNGLQDTRSISSRSPARSVGLGVTLGSGTSSDESWKAERGSPRTLKRAADAVEDLRASSDPYQLRRPASFPVLGSNAYGRSPHSVGQRTPGRLNTMLPGYQGDGHRESGSSSGTLPSPAAIYHDGSGPSDELGLSGTMPPLIRTSQLGSSTPVPSLPASEPKSSPPSSAGTSPRAKLELHGNLNDMAVGWSHDEWRSGRRLVQFWRRQEGTTIHSTFRPILQSQYVANSITISCIFREDKNECFVTSVDAIYLLEALVASRFTVEEKNRIRRNLEGFRPITVSKNKRECEQFFKLIMGFPSPKPRNIEKDVKVFPWKVLASALCKIIGKYSASYDGGLPVLGDLGPDPSYITTPVMGGSAGLDLTYREASNAGLSPQGKDSRLSESALEYERQSGGGSANMYAMQSVAPYGSNNAWPAGGQQQTASFVPSMPSQTNTTYTTYPAQNQAMHLAHSYDGFSNSNNTNIDQSLSSGGQNMIYSQSAAPQQDTSLLSGATPAELYTARRA